MIKLNDGALKELHRSLQNKIRNEENSENPNWERITYFSGYCMALEHVLQQFQMPEKYKA